MGLLRAMWAWFTRGEETAPVGRQRCPRRVCEGCGKDVAEKRDGTLYGHRCSRDVA